MKFRFLLLIFCLCIPFSFARAETDWSKGEPPLKTRWFDSVTPDNALPEYPRPQMVRQDWLNLNGLWQFAPAPDTRPPFEENLPERILVSYPVESSLSGIMRHEASMWYRHEVTIPTKWQGRRVLLHFGAVDWQSTLYVNGQKVGTHQGGYDSFSFDITPYVQWSGTQELLLYVSDPTTAGGQPRGKQSLVSRNIWYTSTSGIWQTVWMEPVASTAVTSLNIIPDIDAETLRLTVHTSTPDAHVLAEVTDSGNSVAKAEGDADKEIGISIPKPKLWSPESPFLYDLNVTLQKGGQTVDEVRSYFGMRKIAVGRVDGVMRILLNNQFYFQIGALDQGFWPDGIYTAPTDEALKYDIEFAKQVGWNVLRKHVKVEPERWYYWADKLGMLVWQDMPSGDPENVLPFPTGDYQAELAALIQGRRNHPSIIMWVLFNEGWGQAQFTATDIGKFVGLTRKLDPTRLVNNASGWDDFGVGDIIDLHHYVGPDSPAPDNRRAAVEGEFGGLGLRVPGHMWPGETFAYEWQHDSQTLTTRYIGLLERAKQLIRVPSMSAAIYTELSDVQQELNGFMTYDREVIKVDVKKVRAANQSLIQSAQSVIAK